MKQSPNFIIYIRLYYKSLKKREQIMMIVDSSTPDGLAPLSDFALIILISSVSGISVLWGLFNFVRLWRVGPEYEEGILTNSNQMEEVREMGRKIITGSNKFMAFNFLLTIIVTLIYSLLIMVTVQQFDTFELSFSYILGFCAAYLCGIFIVFTSGVSYFKIVHSSRLSGDSAFTTAKFASNSITFTTIGLALASLLVLFVQFEPVHNSKQQQINHFSDIFINFSFGYVTVAICMKITSLIYLKGSQNSFQMLQLFNLNIPLDNKHPMIICKCIGENINKSLSKSLDYLMYICLLISLSIKAAALNIIGTDQEGEIIFNLAYENTYSGLVLFGFGLFFSLLFTLVQGWPSNQNEVKLNFMFKTIGMSAFLFGFTALACYLTLPAEFEIKQFIDQQSTSVTSPLFAYLLVLIGMILSILLTFSSQIIGSSPIFIYSLMRSCKTGAATCIISGLSMGYLYNILPAIAVAAFGVLCYNWLGVFGVCMGTMGFAIFIPYYMNMNLYHSVMNTSSMMGFVNKIDEQTISNLISMNESKKYFEQKVFIHFNTLSSLLGYVSLAVFVQYTGQNLSITEGEIFAGILIGAMVPYIFVGLIIKSCYHVSPILCYDLQEQVETNPGIQRGQVEIDINSSSHIFTVNSILQIVKFIPIIILPFVIGALLEIQVLIGLMCGVSISAFQLAISSSISGVLWGNVRDEIAYGRAKDQENNDIAINSEWGTAAQVGKNIGSNLKDSAGQACHVLTFWIITCTYAFQVFYSRQSQ